MIHIVTTARDLKPEVLEKINKKAKKGYTLTILYAKNDVVYYEYSNLVMRMNVDTSLVCVPFKELNKASLAFYLGNMFSQLEVEDKIYCYHTFSDLANDLIPTAAGAIKYGNRIYITDDIDTIFSKENSTLLLAN